MAKKTKDEVPNANNIVNKDIMQRLNFMYQASVYLSGVLPIVPPPSSVAPRRRQKKSRKMTVHDLSKSYINSMKIVANKTMVKMDPAIKRTLCNGCNMVLIPGSTASIRVKSSREHGHVMFYRCDSCNSSRRIPAPPTLVEPAVSTSESAATSIPAADAMHLDEPLKARNRKSAPLARLPPLFAREAGHVVYCGNNALLAREPQLECGDGIYIT